MINIRSGKQHHILLIIAVVLASVIGSVLIIVNEINRPITRDKHLAAKIIKKKTDINVINGVERFAYNDIQFAVAGQKDNGQNVYAVISKHGSQINIFKQSSGLSKHKVLNLVKDKYSPKKITSSSLGIVDKKPVWVVTYINNHDKLIFKTINFKNGKPVKTVSTF